MKRWCGLALTVAAVMAVAGSASGGERSRPASDQGVCEPPRQIYRPPVRKGQSGGFVSVPGRCFQRDAHKAPFDDLLGDILDPAADERPDPSHTPEQVEAAVDRLFRIAAETGPALSSADLTIEPRAYAGSGFERCRRRPLGLKCEASFRHDLEAGRAYARVLGEAVARRQAARGWTVSGWRTRESFPNRTDLEARGVGHPSSVLVSKLEADYGNGAWVAVDLTLDGDGPAP